jgi:metal-responsive CopG/Arc/MetJ family transcriptional regulator
MEVIKMLKINVSFPEDFLAEIDEIAKEEGKSRSKILREAVKNYIKNYREKKAEEKRKANIQEAIKIQDKLRKKAGNWNGVAEIRKWRERI